MENVEYAIAYKEVYEILKYIPKTDYNKIPSEKIELYKTMQDKNYNFKYNPSKTLDEQNVSKRAKAIIGLLFRDYWATDEQRNKIKAFQNNKRHQIDEENRKKYNTDIFKNRNNTVNENKQIENIQNVSLVEYKESVFTKILNKIKSIFKRN